MKRQVGKSQRQHGALGDLAHRRECDDCEHEADTGPTMNSSRMMRELSRTLTTPSNPIVTQAAMAATIEMKGLNTGN